MRKAKGKKGLTTEVVVDSKGQPFDKHVQLREMHAGDAAIQVFTWLTGEITPSQRATLVREFGMMIAEHGKFLGDYPNPGTPYKPGTVIWWGSEKNLGIVEEFHENAIQVRRVNERGRAYTTVIDMIGTSEVEGRVGIEGLILETAVRNPLAISPAMAGLLKNPGAISELFLLKDVMTSVKGTILDKLSCTADEYLAVIRANKRSDRGFVTKLAQKAKDDRATVLVAIYSLQPDLLDGVTDQELLAAIVGLDMKSLTSKLGEYGHVRE
ncbi:MAG: hypothetical protein PHC70_02505, partial [Patescibacteria group bacterium]|nr:hypothetical protein [Patescibacteria group bacterium]